MLPHNLPATHDLPPNDGFTTAYLKTRLPRRPHGLPIQNEKRPRQSYFCVITAKLNRSKFLSNDTVVFEATENIHYRQTPTLSVGVKKMWSFTGESYSQGHRVKDEMTCRTLWFAAPLVFKRRFSLQRISFSSNHFFTPSLLLHHFFFFPSTLTRTTDDLPSIQGHLNDERRVTIPFSPSCSSCLTMTNICLLHQCYFFHYDRMRWQQI
jgi:hypothetical protein